VSPIVNGMVFLLDKRSTVLSTDRSSAQFTT